MNRLPPAAARRHAHAVPPLPPSPPSLPSFSPPSPLYHWRPVSWVARLLARAERHIRRWCVDGTFACASIPVYRDASGYWWIAWPEEGSFDIPADTDVATLTLVANGTTSRTSRRSGYQHVCRQVSRRRRPDSLLLSA